MLALAFTAVIFLGGVVMLVIRVAMFLDDVQ